MAGSSDDSGNDAAREVAATNPFAASEEDTAAADSTFRAEYQPIERDETETQELLQLSRLEGRDPLQDAVAGRLALDRLDATADSDVDPARAAWADQLRRELRERFNDIAPTKFTLGEPEA